MKKYINNIETMWKWIRLKKTTYKLELLPVSLEMSLVKRKPSLAYTPSS